MSDTSGIPEDDDAILAAEYVLGLLSDAETAVFERRLAREPDLRDLVDAWQEHLADLLADTAPVAPPPAIQARIIAQLFGRQPPLWKRLRLGQALLGGALAAGIALAALRFGWLDPESGAPFVAALTNAEAGEVARIALDPDSGRIAAELTGLFPDPGRARELWLIQGDNPPVSLGLLAPGIVVALTLPEALRATVPGAVLAISDEPEGGSPTGQPTGAVLATGPVTAAS